LVLFSMFSMFSMESFVEHFVLSSFEQTMDWDTLWTEKKKKFIQKNKNKKK
jgi:hypothetical protein